MRDLIDRYQWKVADKLQKVFHTPLTMTKSILSQAKTWGFICQCDRQGNWQILPQQPTEKWKLQQVEDRWLLLVGDVPQISCDPTEAIAFLERRWSSCQI